MKKTICMLLATLMLLTFAACGEQTPDTPANNPVEDLVTDLVTDLPETPDDTDETEAPTQPAAARYASDTMIPYLNAPETFRDFADQDQKYYWTKDERLVHVASGEEGWDFGANAQVEKMLYYLDGPAYLDAQNNLFLYEDGNTYPCLDVKGEVVWWFESMMGGEMTVVSLDSDGTLYLNTIEKTGAKGEYDNLPIVLKDSLTKETYDRFHYVRFIDDDIQHDMYAELDDRVVYCNVAQILTLQNKPMIFVNSCPVLPENVVAYGYNAAGTPLYKQPGDNTALYYSLRYDDAQLPVLMPEGKTVDQLTQVVFGEMTLLLFADGSVYTCILENSVLGSKPQYCPELSQLNQDGAICKIYQSTFDSKKECVIRFLLDDNVVYDWNPA